MKANCRHSQEARLQHEPSEQTRRGAKSDEPRSARIVAPTSCARGTQRRVRLSSNRLLRGATAGCLLVCLLVLAGPPLHKPNGVEAAKALKALAKTFVFQQLTMRKNFLPLPVPIPVPIEINEPPVYLRGKPKYVNVYKPKPTSPPIVKPTTVYHMPIYSPTYEYMSMDPMSSMYGHVAPAVYPTSSYAAKSGGHGSNSPASAYRTHLDADSDSPMAHSGAMMNFNDYDDESGHYYMGRAGRRRAKLFAGDYISGASLDLHNRNDDAPQAHSSGNRDDLTAASTNSNEIAAAAKETDEATRDSEQHSSSVDHGISPNEDESYDHDDDKTSQGQAGLRRSKRQVYYQSGYNGKENCDGFPLEVNVRSRIKLDRIFPIHGKSQVRKCIQRKKPFHILPPPPEDHY